MRLFLHKNDVCKPANNGRNKQNYWIDQTTKPLKILLHLLLLLILAKTQVVHFPSFQIKIFVLHVFLSNYFCYSIENYSFFQTASMDIVYITMFCFNDISVNADAIFVRSKSKGQQTQLHFGTSSWCPFQTCGSDTSTALQWLLWFRNSL